MSFCGHLSSYGHFVSLLDYFLSLDHFMSLWSVVCVFLLAISVSLWYIIFCHFVLIHVRSWSCVSSCSFLGGYGFFLVIFDLLWSVFGLHVSLTGNFLCLCFCSKWLFSNKND